MVLLPFITAPSGPSTLGWWSGGARPGAARGRALITGHTVHTGGGAFDNLETLKCGDDIAVRTVKGLINYAVSGVRIYRKASLAQDARQVFSQSGPGQLASAFGRNPGPDSGTPSGACVVVGEHVGAARC